jgi:hypothetical protein
MMITPTDHDEDEGVALPLPRPKKHKVYQLFMVLFFAYCSLRKNRLGSVRQIKKYVVLLTVAVSAHRAKTDHQAQ